MSVTDFRVSEPKTPYEYSSKDHFLTAQELEEIITVIQPQLDADARLVERLLRESNTGNLFFYERNILRVSLAGTSLKQSHGVLSRELRVKYLLRNIKVPFTSFTRSEGNGNLTCFMRVYNATA